MSSRAAAVAGPARGVLALASFPRSRTGEALPHGDRGNLASRIVQAIGLAAVVGVGLTWLLATISPGETLPAVMFWTAAATTVACLPGVAWMRGPRSLPPIVEAICFSYAAQYALPAVALPNQMHLYWGQEILDEGTLVQTLQVTTLGLIVLLGTYFTGLRFLAGRGLRTLTLPIAPERFRVYASAAVFAGLTADWLSVTGRGPSGDSGFAAFEQVFLLQLNVATALLSYLVFGRHKRERYYLLLLVLAVGGGTALGTAGGFLEGALTQPVIVLLIAFQTRRRWVVPTLVAAALLVLLVLNPIKAAYRASVWYGEDTLTTQEKLAVWTNLAVQQAESIVSTGTGEQTVATLQQSLLRLDFAHILAHVKTQTPETIPYVGWAPYRYFVYTWVPRVLWPGKPVASAENKALTISYQLLSERGAESTTMSLGLLGEAEASAGDIGVLLFLFLQGVILAVIVRGLGQRDDTATQAILVAVLVEFLNGIGTTATIWFGNLAQLILVSVLIMRLLSSKASQTEPEHDAQPQAEPSAADALAPWTPWMPRPGKVA